MFLRISNVLHLKFIWHFITCRLSVFQFMFYNRTFKVTFLAHFYRSIGCKNMFLVILFLKFFFPKTCSKLVFRYDSLEMSSIWMFFLHKLVQLRQTVVTSFRVQSWKWGHGLLWEACWGEGEWATGPILPLLPPALWACSLTLTSFPQ